MDAGRLDRRAAFFRRVKLTTPVAGNSRGKFEATPYLTVWADFRQTPGREVVSAGIPEDQIGGTLRIRDSAAARQVTAADRVAMSDASFAIVSVGLPEGREGYIEMILRRELAG
jgi:head-tail adaptor